MYSIGEIGRINAAHKTPEERKLSKKAKAAVRLACERIVDTVDHGPLRNDPDRADDFAFGYVRAAFDLLCDLDSGVGHEFGAVLLTETAAKGVDHIRDTLNRAQ